MHFHGYKKIFNIDGKPVPLDRDNDLTLGAIACNALSMNNDAKLSSDEKLKRFKLALRLHGEALPVEITSDEAALIKKVVNENYPSPMMVGQVFHMIENPGEDSPVATKVALTEEAA